MMQRRLDLIVGLGVAVMLTAAVASSSDRSYSERPLRDPIRDVAENTVEFVKFNNWLNANYESAPQDRRQALREHLYSIIDCHVKQLHERTGKTYPSEFDLTLSGSFVWATRMGAFGADTIVKHLDPERAKLLDSPASPPDSFNLSVDGEYFVLATSLGSWRATFPYYFMVGDLRDFEAANGLRTQIAIISTGFGRHTDGGGSSQATIMLVFSPTGTEPDFNGFWLEKFGLTPPDRLAEPVQRMTAYKRYDPQTKLHTEVVFPKSETGAMAVSYMGLDGTFQWNQEHFEDFLAMLRLNTKE